MIEITPAEIYLLSRGKHQGRIGNSIYETIAINLCTIADLSRNYYKALRKANGYSNVYNHCNLVVSMTTLISQENFCFIEVIDNFYKIRLSIKTHKDLIKQGWDICFNNVINTIIDIESQRLWFHHSAFFGITDINVDWLKVTSNGTLYNKDGSLYNDKFPPNEPITWCYVPKKEEILEMIKQRDIILQKLKALKI